MGGKREKRIRRVVRKQSGKWYTMLLEEIAKENFQTRLKLVWQILWYKPNTKQNLSKKGIKKT